MKKFFAVIIMISFIIPVLAIDETELNLKQEETIETKESAQNSIQNAYNAQQNIEPVSQYKVPYSKKKLAKKFILAMLCVAGCSATLYGVLTVYNKIRDGIFLSSDKIQESESQLDKPCDLTEAVKTFIDKTKWNC